MNYSKIVTCDFANGEGMRVALFVSGCNHRCKGCYNESTWDPSNGHKFTVDVLESLLDAVDMHHGLSISGGDPFHKDNRKEVLKICEIVKNRFPTKDIWLWTGYTKLQLQRAKIDLSNIDVLIDGKYRESLPTSKPWRGSDNQVLWDLRNERTN